MSAPLVVGIDAGGTSTRALVRTVDGEVRGVAHGEGANPNSHPAPVAARRIAETAAAALAATGDDPAAVRAAVLGLAGETKLVDPDVAAMFETAWQQTGIAARQTVLSDAEVAFASGTPAAAGTVLIAGTGSIALAIEEHRRARVAGGYGWLLGDEGSGFWIGREAVRTLLAQIIDGAPSELGRAVFAASVGGEPESGVPSRMLFSQVITAANAGQPVHLARFAPLVSEAAATDPAAAAILDAAVEHLCGIALDARRGAGTAEDAPVVLTGGLIGPGGPLTERLRARLAEVTATTVLLATDGAAGAAWLAALLVDPAAEHPLAGHPVA